jgi:hypothetical protein
MPLQNRVTPAGEIVAIAARGTLMGNRGGALHDAQRRLGTRRWVSRQWICCRLHHAGRKRQVMAPGRYTELFFLDEATALAAGHRPCFECRRADALAFAKAWAHGHGMAELITAGEMDRVLHRERLLEDGGKRTSSTKVEDLPDGVIVREGETGQPHLVLAGNLHAWSFEGYGPPRAGCCQGLIQALTPPSIIAALKSGYRASVHVTATVSG